MNKADQYDVILGPVITEKSTLGSEFNQVTFEVPMTSTKPQIRNAVEGLFNVKVKAVNTVRLPGKSKRFRGIVGAQPSKKKAIVTLHEGHSIDISAPKVS